MTKPDKSQQFTISLNKAKLPLSAKELAKRLPDYCLSVAEQKRRIAEEKERYAPNWFDSNMTHFKATLERLGKTE